MKDARNLDKQWVVLSELSAELVGRGVKVPETVFEKLRLANALLSYYILDPHASVNVLSDVERELNFVQSQLFSLCDVELTEKYLNKMMKAVRGELDVKFPLSKSKYNKEVKKRGRVESVRIKLKKEIQIERLGDLGEWHGVIFEYSDEKDKVVIEGSMERVKKALKDFAILWKED
ncbi:DUF2096 domain-containing protein [Methanocaldococcus fervens]|uniref:Uncharacterized conserved protein UCP037052 n=1 Tax=Methanocaldococcus fervens (strain DSM 4213 / JCM 15782 / AG86) TaxID=573064 RepID=C7P8P5_METFA|nr:DUF2096 family protein [Methanocaldococcus fervens]ACV24927.1 Uncharacterized conserved protein UCP037052 [Methanocaldococcus fervens AG86]